MARRRINPSTQLHGSLDDVGGYGKKKMDTQ
jgi:hypothetical protein